MIKIAFASGFVAGALVMSIFFGSQTSILVQAASSGNALVVKGSEPIVPPLRGHRVEESTIEKMQMDMITPINK